MATSGILRYVEVGLGTVLSPFKNHYDQILAANNELLSDVPSANLEVSSPDYDASSAKHLPEFVYGDLRFPTHALKQDHTQFDANEMLPLQWSGPPEVLAKVKEWAVFIEDPDAPFPHSNPHAIFHHVAPDVRSITNDSIAAGSPAGSAPVPKSSMACVGGFYAGLNRRRVIYIGPRPPMGHGLHRYFHQVVGLSEEVDWEKVCQGKEGVGPAELVAGCKGRVVAWGCWVGGVDWRWPGKLAWET